jgi:hypothetical protein
MTSVLAISGLGFGHASMSYLLAAQNAVAWQQRGVVTAGVGFCRTMGGAMGVGLLGALFNNIISRDLARFRAMGLKPAELLDPNLARNVPQQVLREVHQTIGGGVIWVFVAMALLSVALLAVSSLLPSRRAASDAQPVAEPALA